MSKLFKWPMRLALALALAAMGVLGLQSAAQATIHTNEIFKFCDVNENRLPAPGTWTGHMSFYVAWNTNDNSYPLPTFQTQVNAGYDPPGPVGPGIQIWNYTNYDVDIIDVSYYSDAGLYGSYQGNPIFTAGNGGHSGVAITNALWASHPPSHWLPTLNHPEIQIQFRPHNNPPMFPYDSVFCHNFAPVDIYI